MCVRGEVEFKYSHAEEMNKNSDRMNLIIGISDELHHNRHLRLKEFQFKFIIEWNVGAERNRKKNTRQMPQVSFTPLTLPCRPKSEEMISASQQKHDKAKCTRQKRPNSSINSQRLTGKRWRMKDVRWGLKYLSLACVTPLPIRLFRSILYHNSLSIAQRTINATNSG